MHWVLETVELYYLSACLLICLMLMHNASTLSLSYFQTVCSKNWTESLMTGSSGGRQNMFCFCPYVLWLVLWSQDYAPQNRGRLWWQNETVTTAPGTVLCWRALPIATSKRSLGSTEPVIGSLKFTVQKAHFNWLHEVVLSVMDFVPWLAWTGGLTCSFGLVLV